MGAVGPPNEKNGALRETSDLNAAVLHVDAVASRGRNDTGRCHREVCKGEIGAFFRNFPPLVSLPLDGKSCLPLYARNPKLPAPAGS